MSSQPDDVLDNILFETIESSARYGKPLTADEADYIQEQALAAIKAFIVEQVRLARIDELKELQVIIALTDRVTLSHVKDRIADLQKPTNPEIV